MALFLAVLLLELAPMITFIRWRIARGRKQPMTAGPSIDTLVRINDAEIAILFLIPFAAALMARAVWLF
jgi:putative membrane protein